ncbi:hypothetical protein SDC9_49396 [bioreactor metagenome]|uniref:Uncharacterized protein n=1 Tax=bioreactor metagenome TaxID=1076179 RepID=A0A644WGY0_9ZZZZ
MRETIVFRDNLEDILAFSNGKHLLTIKDVSTFTGRDPRWCKKAYGIDPAKGISAATLARKLCE